MRHSKTIAPISTAMLAAALFVTGGSPAEASHRPASNEPITRLALRLEGAARELSYRAEHYSHHGTQRERRALRRFDALQDEARDFRVTVQRRGPLSTRSEREYGELVYAFEKAARAFHDSHARKVVRNDFREVQRRMNQLDRALQSEISLARSYRRDRGVRRAVPRYGLSEIAYDGRFGRGEVRIRYAKREDDYDDRGTGRVRYGTRYERSKYDDDSSD